MTVKTVRTEAEWLELRKKVVTATEAPVLLGLNKWMSPNKLRQEKENSTFRGNAYTTIGQWLEPVVVLATNHILGTNFRVIEEEGTKKFYMHEELRLGATPDAIDGDTLLECKTTKPINYLKYQHNAPEYYIMQLMTQMYCAGHKTGYLSIMSTDLSQDSPELKLPISIFKVTLNKQLCEMLRQEVERFWDCWDRGVMFRCNGRFKAQARLLVNISYKQVF